MKQKDDTITNDRQEILNVCSDFYLQELYSSKSNETKPKIVSPDQSALGLPHITVREVEVAKSEMKDNKAPGTDDITSDPGGGGVLTLTWYMYMCLPYGALFREIWYSDRGVFIRDEGAQIT